MYPTAARLILLFGLLNFPFYFPSSALAEDAAKSTEGFHNESEAGVVITAGNADSQSLSFKQANLFGRDGNIYKFAGKFLKTSSRSVETAKSWSLGVRYERELAESWSLFLAETLESDRFSGYLQRYNSDVGAKYYFIKESDFDWSAELGYRYTVENRSGSQVKEHYLRAYSEANRAWNKNFSTKLWAEYLPNLSVSRDYQINSELSASAMLNDVFSIKTAYGVKYRRLLIGPATRKMDSQFTSSLVAKF